MGYEQVGGGFQIPFSPFSTSGNPGERYASLRDGAAVKYSASGLGWLGALGRTSVSQDAQAAALTQLQPVVALASQAGQALQQAQNSNPSVDFSPVSSALNQAQAALQTIVAAVNAPVTPFNENAGFGAQALTQKQQQEAAAIQQAVSGLSQVQQALQGLPQQITMLVRTANANMSQAQSQVQGAISQANSLAQQGEFGQALAILNNPSLATAAQAAGGVVPGSLQQAVQIIQSQQVNAPVTAAKQQTVAAISQAQALTQSGATVSQLQQALSILQGAAGVAAQANMSSQLSAATLGVQQALQSAQQNQVSGQIQAAVANANSIASSGDIASALAILQDPSLAQAASQAGLSSQLSQAAVGIRSQAAAANTSTQQFQQSQVAAQQQCVSQPGMIWTPGFGMNPGTCAPSPQSLQQQQACAAQGGTWTGYGCDMSAKQAADAAAAQQAQLASQQQAAQIQLQQQQNQQQFQLQQGASQSQNQAMMACANAGGSWNPAAGTDAAGNPIGACDMSFVQGQKAQTQQLSAIAQLAQAFMPFLQSNPQLATQVVGQAFGIATGGGMAATVPGEQQQQGYYIQPGGSGGGQYTADFGSSSETF